VDSRPPGPDPRNRLNIFRCSRAATISPRVNRLRDGTGNRPAFHIGSSHGRLAPTAVPPISTTVVRAEALVPPELRSYVCRKSNHVFYHRTVARRRPQPVSRAVSVDTELRHLQSLGTARPIPSTINNLPSPAAARSEGSRPNYPIPPNNRRRSRRDLPAPPQSTTRRFVEFRPLSLFLPSVVVVERDD